MTASLITALAFGGTVVSAATTNTATGSATKGMVYLAVPPANSLTPLTPAQDAYDQAHGRPLPTPELLQPTADQTLADYTPKRADALRGNYHCAASDVLADLSKKWIAGFQKYYPGVHIAVAPPYAGSLGALELIKGNIDCVFVSRELKPTDIQGFHDAFGYDPLSIPISGGSYRHFGFLDSIGFIVNKDNPIDKLSFDQLDSILSTTRNRGGAPITTWGQLGVTGAWADKPIHIVGIQPWNGFEEFVRERVLNYNGKRGEWRPGAAIGSTPADPNVHWEKTVFNVATDVSNDPYAIGYTGMAYVDQPVKVLALSNHAQDPAHAPTYDNVSAAIYPLSRVTYLNMNKQPGHALDPVLEELTRFILSRQGQAVVGKQAVFLPLRESQADASTFLLNSAP
ncbi:PstS family phosphate ABC transporter substrate-binding protein [Streptacidiphilus sp. MAP12-16]|uniref:PstS family phosphate ABC transporter substrate-binding protein n=1 Tax=Streptacidiphilus sp. MAP12-16 TaxID=3156300 RepID=UPI003516B8E8